MDDRIPFSDVCTMLESQGWMLMRIWSPYRVFARPGSRELPILVEVRGRSVALADLGRISRATRPSGS